jgi:hypothetical protein
MRTTEILVCVALAVLVTTVATTRSDTGEEATSASAEPEPISGTIAMPQPGSELAARDPFVQYSTGQEGDPATLWSYQQLGSDQQRIVDRGMVQDHSAVNSAFAAAAMRRTDQARAEGAATQLGADNLDTTGVVE